MTQLGLQCGLFTVEGGRHGVGSRDKDPRFQTDLEEEVDVAEEIAALSGSISASYCRMQAAAVNH
jgi:hypothetical protein